MIDEVSRDTNAHAPLSLSLSLSLAHLRESLIRIFKNTMIPRRHVILFPETRIIAMETLVCVSLFEYEAVRDRMNALRRFEWTHNVHSIIIIIITDN